MKFSISEILPNPYRNVEHYPIRTDKVDALRESLRKTGFWDNVVARKNKDGKPEIAYGHHRLKALEAEYPPEHKVNLIIKPLSNDEMIEIMSRENMEQWGSNAMVEQETVRAVVEAYGRGEIKLDSPINGTDKRHLKYADILAIDHEYPYTAETIAAKCGWYTSGGKPNVHKVRSALSTLELVNSGLATEDDFEGFTTQAARATVKVIKDIIEPAKERADYLDKEGNEVAAKVVRENAEVKAKAAIQTAKTHIDDGGGYRDIAVAVAVAGFKDRNKRIPEINDYMFTIANRFGGYLQDESKIMSGLDEALEYIDQIDEEVVQKLVNSLTHLITRATHLRDRMTASRVIGLNVITGGKK